MRCVNTFEDTQTCALMHLNPQIECFTYPSHLHELGTHFKVKSHFICATVWI